MNQPAHFMKLVASEFDLDPLSLTGNEKLVDDLEFDSFDLLKLLIIAESLRPGLIVPEDVNFSTVTLSDVVEYLQR